MRGPCVRGDMVILFFSDPAVFASIQKGGSLEMTSIRKCLKLFYKIASEMNGCILTDGLEYTDKPAKTIAAILGEIRRFFNKN